MNTGGRPIASENLACQQRRRILLQLPKICPHGQINSFIDRILAANVRITSSAK